MSPDSARDIFLDRLRMMKKTLASLLPEEGVEEMIRFYRDIRFEGCDMDQDGDMLLFQWGTNDWGDGEFFDLNITRQVIECNDRDDNIRQLSLTFRYAPNQELTTLESGNQWCYSTKDMSIFGTFVTESAALKAVSRGRPIKVDCSFTGI